MAVALAAFGVYSGAEAPIYATLYQFTGYLGGPDGFYPIAPVVVGSDGVLFGATRLGGVVNATCPQGCGTAFSLTPPPTFRWDAMDRGDSALAYRRKRRLLAERRADHRRWRSALRNGGWRRGLGVCHRIFLEAARGLQPTAPM
jgi:hypothetical protein